MFRNVARARVDPIASTTRVVVNVRADDQHFRKRALNVNQSVPGNVEPWNTLAGEILVTNTMARDSYRDPKLRVYPFCDWEMRRYALAQFQKGTNNWQVRKSDKTEVTMERANNVPKVWHAELEALKKTKLVGTARTYWDFGRQDIHHDQGYAGHRSGLCTTVNTGSKEICPGDIIRIGLPDLSEKQYDTNSWTGARAGVTTIRGVHRKKQLFATTIYDPQQILEDMRGKDEPTTATNTADAVKAYNAQLRYLQQAESLILGMAVSRSSPGERLDIAQYTPSSYKITT